MTAQYTWYIAKPGGWFDEGTKAQLIDSYRPDRDIGLFLGYKNGQLDEEICPFDEFQGNETDDKDKMLNADPLKNRMIKPEPQSRYSNFCRQCGRWHIAGASYSCGVDIHKAMIDSKVHFDGYSESESCKKMNNIQGGATFTCEGCFEYVTAVTLYHKPCEPDLWLCDWCGGRV